MVQFYRKKKGQSLFAGIAAISFSVMIFEISLTRIFSVKYDYHYAFLAISIAIVGIGLGGILLNLASFIESEPEEEIIMWAGPICSLSLFCFLLTISLTKGSWGLFAGIISALIPFLSCGIILSYLFRSFAEHMGKLYGFDLLGASLGTILVVPLLKMGAISSILTGGISASIGWSIIPINSRRGKKRITQFLISILPIPVLGIHFYNGFPGKIPVDPYWEKEMGRILGLKWLEGEVIESRWSAFGRTDLIAFRKLPDAMMLFIDGSAGTLMFRFNGDLNSQKNVVTPYLTRHFSGSVPFAIAEPQHKERVLIIGSGGGGDVLTALLGGAKKVTAVEINGDMVSIVRKYSHYNGGIYGELSGVEVIVAEGRNFLKRTKESYDIILLTLPVTKSSRTPDAYSLSENFLFTIESIKDYLDHLTQMGQLAIVAHNDREIIRLVFLAIEALRSLKIPLSESLKYIYTTGEEQLPLFVLQRSPIDLKRLDKLKEVVFARGYPLYLTYIPGYINYSTRLDLPIKDVSPAKVLSLMANGKARPSELIEELPFDCRPVSDESPFFFKMEKGLPNVLNYLLMISLSLALMFFLLQKHLVPMDSRRRTPFFSLIFASIGMGFMLIEVPLLQKFTLFLGHPVYSLCIILLFILLGAGLGSFISSKTQRFNSMTKFKMGTFLIALMCLLHIIFINKSFILLMGSPFLIRAIFSGIALFPLGFSLGIPFPMGLKAMHELNLSKGVAGVWGINGIFSVIGSTLSIVISIKFGFFFSIILGGSIYLLLGILTHIIFPKWDFAK
jgi:hypothetical protein